LFDAIVVENCESDRRLADSANANESEWGEVLPQTDELLDQLVSSKEVPRWWWW